MTLEDFLLGGNVPSSWVDFLNLIAGNYIRYQRRYTKIDFLCDLQYNHIPMNTLPLCDNTKNMVLSYFENTEKAYLTGTLGDLDPEEIRKYICKSGNLYMIEGMHIDEWGSYDIASVAQNGHLDVIEWLRDPSTGGGVCE